MIFILNSGGRFLVGEYLAREFANVYYVYDAGGNVLIGGLENHVSSSAFNKTLKISHDNMEVPLLSRQAMRQNLAKEKDYQFASQV